MKIGKQVNEAHISHHKTQNCCNTRPPPPSPPSPCTMSSESQTHRTAQRNVVDKRHRVHRNRKRKIIIYNNYKMAKRNGVKYLSVSFGLRCGASYATHGGRYGYFGSGERDSLAPLLCCLHRQFDFGFLPRSRWVRCDVCAPRDHVWASHTFQRKKKKNAHVLHVNRLNECWMRARLLYDLCSSRAAYGLCAIADGCAIGRFRSFRSYSPSPSII